MLTVQKTCALRRLGITGVEDCCRVGSRLGNGVKKWARNAALYSQSQWRSMGIPLLRPSWSTISQVDYPGIVVEELSTVFGNLKRDTFRVFDVPLAKVLQDGSQTVIPLLLLCLRLAWVGGPELDQERLT